MGSFVVFTLISGKEARRCINGITAWFKKNKTRDVCRTDIFKVRRGHVIDDILRYTEVKAADKIRKNLKKSKIKI